MIKKSMIFIFILIILSTFSYADYEQIGGTNGVFSFDGNGNFNSNLNNYSIETIGVSSSGLAPFISDLDNDGTKEIIIFDSNSVEIYQGRELTPVGAYVFLNLSTTLEPSAIIFDIDGDGIKEIIASASNNPVIEIVEYNGTHTFLDGSFQIDGINCYNSLPDPIINCRGVNDCLLITPQSKLAQLSAQRIRACSFNSTSFIDRGWSVQSYNSGDYACVGLSSIPRIEIADYDQDNEEEYIISFVNYLRNTGSGGGQTRIAFISVDGSGIINFEKEIQTTEIDYFGAEPSYTSFPCNRFARFFTSPTTDNYEGNIFNGLETVVGFTDDQYSFVMESFDKTGARIDRHPDINTFDPDGELVSNIMSFEAFPDSDYKDFCVMGFDQTNQKLSLLCSSFDSGLSFNDDEVFEIKLSSFNPSFNISTESRTYNRISHAGQHRQTKTKKKNLNELISTYGVFSLEYTAFSPHILTSEFETGVGDGAVISDDAENKGLDDLIVLTDSNLWYIDDRLTNDQAYFNGLYEIDPCIDQPIKINETMTMFFTAIDNEGENINFTAYVYYNDSNEQIYNEIGNSGKSFQTGFFFLNKTITNGDIRLEVRDIQPENQNNPDVLNFKFTVASDGVKYQSGCKTTGFIQGVSPTDKETIDNTTMTENDKNAIVEAIAPTGVIPQKYRPLWALFILIICVIGTLVLLIKQDIRDSSVLIYIPLAIGLIIWLFLVFLRMIAGWTIIVAIILASAFLGAKFIPMRQGA